MKKFADRKRKNYDFQLEDQVWVKQRPYRQHSVQRRFYGKLNKWFYGPYLIIEKINIVAYQLALPLGSLIHLEFHISLLKPFIGDKDFVGHLDLPPLVIDTQSITILVKVAGYHVGQN